MFSPNQFNILADVARLHQEDLLHEAEGQRLVRFAQSTLRGPSVLKKAAWWVGAAMIALGERLAPAPAVSSARLTEKCA